MYVYNVVVMYKANYMCEMFLACVVLINFIGGLERLNCTHEVLLVVYDNPSAFCQFSGMYS